MKISVIISTYNQPQALEKVLLGYRCQTERDFEIIIADDGSRSDTRDLVSSLANDCDLPMTPLWHEDRGFRKNKILNEAICAAHGDYLIFTDGDCIPRDDFVAMHRALARRHWFVVGGSHINLPPDFHRRLCPADIVDQRIFHPSWLKMQAVRLGKHRWRLTRRKALARWLDWLTPRPGIFVGCNSGVWRDDALAIGGFDETFGYGLDDKEFGVRLTNHGVRSRRMKHSLIAIHLDHPRPYLDRASLDADRERVRQLRRSRIVQPLKGIDWTANASRQLATVGIAR
jgi:glycosyltransferase involved in cell wall biosynthesis